MVRSLPMSARSLSRRRMPLVLAALLALSACGSETGPGTSPPPTTAAPSASSAPAATALPSTPLPGSATPTSEEYDEVAFDTPSKNIRCSMTSGPQGDGARCDIGVKQWKAPPQPSDCTFDWGDSLFLTKEEAGFACVSDAFVTQKVLAYGQVETLGDVTCRSSKTGVRCHHRESRHGFDVSRSRYLLF